MVGRVARVDAGTTKEEQSLHSCFPSAVNEIVLNLQIVVNKFSRSRVIGQNSADASGGEEDEFGLASA